MIEQDCEHNYVCVLVERLHLLMLLFSRAKEKHLKEKKKKKPGEKEDEKVIAVTRTSFKLRWTPFNLCRQRRTLRRNRLSEKAAIPS